MITIFCNLFGGGWFGGGAAAGAGGAAGAGDPPLGPPPVPRQDLGPGNCPREQGGSTTGNADEDDYDDWRDRLNDFLDSDEWNGDQDDWETANNILDIMKDHPGKHQHAEPEPPVEPPPPPPPRRNKYWPGQDNQA